MPIIDLPSLPSPQPLVRALCFLSTGSSIPPSQMEGSRPPCSALAGLVTLCVFWAHLRSFLWPSLRCTPAQRWSPFRCWWTRPSPAFTRGEESCLNTPGHKILQAKLQQYMNRELPDVQAGFSKGRGTRDQIANIRWIMEKAREKTHETPPSS